MDPTAHDTGPRPRLLPGVVLVVALVVAVATMASGAHARRASVSLHADAGASGTSVGSTLAVAAMRVGGVDVDGWLRLGVRTADPTAPTSGAAAPRRTSGHFGVGAAWRRVTTFGQLGNVTVEGGASLTTHGDGDPPLGGRLWLGARGTVATVALSLALEAGTDAPRAVDPSRPPPPDAAGQAALRALDDQRARARLERGDWDLGGRLGVVYRLDRATTLDVAASGRSLAGAPALGLSVDLRRSGVATDLDARFGLRLEHLAGATSGAAGAGVAHAPRRGPTSWLYVSVGLGPAGLRPGVEGRWVTRALPGELVAQASWRPWLAASAWRTELEYRHDLAEGDVRWSVALEGVPTGGARFTTTVRWERPW